MHASLRRYVMGAGSIDALMHRIDEEFAPALGQQPGFVGYFALDIGGGAIETISIFHDEASAEHSNQLAGDYVAENLGEFEMTRTAVTAGEVWVSRAALTALYDAHRWRTGRARARACSTAALSNRPVLVTGATGRTGRLIVDRLLERGVPVRALVRNPAMGRRLLPTGVRQFVGDVRNINTLGAPVAGVSTVIIATSGGVEHHNSAELVDYFGTSNVIRQALASHVELVIFISTLGATGPEHYLDTEPSSVGWKAQAEELIRGSGIPYCIIRAGWLKDGAGGQPLSVSQGDTVRGPICRADLAEVCARVLLLPSARGKTIDVVAARQGSGNDFEAVIAACDPDSPREPHVRARSLATVV
jgi:uncharacterized protein YbjT (DUF2867 family)